MRSHRTVSLAALCLSLSAISGCGSSGSNPAPTNRSAPTDQSGGDNVVNLYIWSDYLAPDTLATFEKQTGIKVNVSFFETNETLESRILTGHSGFDVVVPTAPFLERQIRSGAYLPLNKAQLPNLSNLDHTIMARVALNDPGNAHAVVYAWGTYGIGYNEKLVGEALPGIALDSWRLIFDPAYASKLAKCGISTLDAPAGVIRLMLKFLGRNPNAPTSQDLADVETALSKIRPYIRTIDSQNIAQAMANGDVCLALGYNGDFVQARTRAKEAHNGVRINFVVPREGSLIWFDMLAIPKDAPHAANAHRFINYLMNPQVAATLTNFIGYANANSAATPLLDAPIASDPIIFPPPDQQERLFVQMDDSPEQSRAMTRIWQRFKTAQ